jgi:hypothetical protein
VTLDAAFRQGMQQQLLLGTPDRPAHPCFARGTFRAEITLPDGTIKP